MELPLITEIDLPSWYRGLVLSQIEAATYTHRVLANMDLKDPSLTAVAETDVFRLRRGLCLPYAAAVSINVVSKRRVIGDGDGRIKVGDFYRWALPFHNRRSLINLDGQKIREPWWFTTRQGDVYHHALVAIARGFGIAAVSVGRL